MAIWQYTFEIIPKGNLSTLDISQMKRDDYDESVFWTGFAYDLDFFTPITRSLTKSKSWSYELVIYGKKDSTCIKFSVTKHIVEAVTLRINYEKDYSTVLNDVLEFCQLNNFVLLSENLEIVPLDSVNITHIIQNSQQFNMLALMRVNQT